MNKIKTLLIANRGEIACRIIRTAKNLNIKTVAVYAEPDRCALHCQLADVAYCVGPAPADKSYLNIENILKVAADAKVDAIHPGYGFLSENAAFADACQKKGFIFVGPSSDAIAKMAVKDEAKDLMIKAGVPTVPGYMGKAQDNNTLSQAAKEIGYPVILKAAFGGGGKGMRVVSKEAQLADAIETAKRESQNSFGKDTLFIEKYLTESRHIEVQIFRDSFGNCVHLFERDCSLQRRHQKIIEESPAIGIKPEVKQQLYQAAINAANAIDYQGAGTIEFLYKDEKFYFMEMNTRLQVEHPVTEMVTGLDLVEWQLLVADGQALPLTQAQITAKGHAIEARIYAEDPYHQFLPASGKIKDLLLPVDNHVRIDSGITVDDNVSIYFDPMLAKLIVWGEDKAQAIQRMKDALNHFHLVGVTTNLPFLRNVIEDSTFAKNIMHTQYVESDLEALLPKHLRPSATLLAVACMIELHHREVPLMAQEPHSPWASLAAWRLNLPSEETLSLQYLQEDVHFKVLHPREESDFFKLSVGTDNAPVKIKSSFTKQYIHAEFETHEINTYYYADNACIEIFYEGIAYHLKRKIFSSEDIASYNPAHSLIAPMPGIISKIWVKAGETVSAGTKLVALEAMKMEHTVFSPQDGLVKAIRYQLGDQVEEGCELIDFE